MKRIDQIQSPLRKQGSHASSGLWTASVFTTALLVSITLAFCQGGNTKDEKAPDGGFVTGGGPGVSGFTHLVFFRPIGDFNPRNAGEFLAPFRSKLVAEGPQTGYFRTKPVEGKLIGSLCTGNPEALEQFINSVPEIEFIRLERLTKESFEAYEKTAQESLPPVPPADGGFVTGGGPGVSGFTHLVFFRPIGDFNPRNAGEFLSPFRSKLVVEGPQTGYFRTKPVEGKLIGSLCTGNPEALEQFINSVPEIEFIRSERLTKESFEAYEKTAQVSLPPADGGYAVPEGGFTHMLVYGPKGDFVPKTPMDYLNISHPHYAEFRVHNGYFRTRVEEGKLMAYHLTTTPVEFRQLIESIPQFEYIKTERLTKEMFEAHEKTQQELLPSPRMSEIEQSEWYGKLTEPQKRYVQWDESQFAYAYDPKNYDVGDDRAAVETRWLEELAKPEPGWVSGSLGRYDEAIIGLAMIKSDQALPPLVKIAAEKVVKDNAHRHYAVKALGMLGDPAAIPELIPLVYHFNMNTRWEAQISLVQLTGQNFGTDTQAWGEWYMENRDKLGENLPMFDAAPVDWTFGSNHSELRRWSDPKVQEESDRRQFGQ